MIVLAGLNLSGDNTLQRVASILQLPVDDCQQQGRSTTGYRLAETLLGTDLAVLRIDRCFLGTGCPR